MRRLWERWLALWLTPEAATSQAVFRAATGACVLVSLLSVLAHGDARVFWLAPADGGYAPLPGPPWPLSYLGEGWPGAILPTAGVALAGALCLLLGLGGRAPALLTLWAYDALTALRPSASGSYDPLLTNALWLVFLSGGWRTLSLDCRLRTGRWADLTPVPAWPRYLAIYQMVLVYLSTGLQKVSEAWVPGGSYSAVYYTLQQPTWQRIDMRWLAPAYPLTQVLTAATWWFEVGAPLLLLALWYRRTADRPGRLRALFNRVPYRALFALFGVGLHLSIFAFMVLGPFTWMMLSFYLCLVRPEDWNRLYVRLVGKRAVVTPAPT